MCCGLGSCRLGVALRLSVFWALRSYFLVLFLELRPRIFLQQERSFQNLVCRANGTSRTNTTHRLPAPKPPATAMDPELQELILSPIVVAPLIMLLGALYYYDYPIFLPITVLFEGLIELVIDVWAVSNACPSDHPLPVDSLS